VLPTTGKEAALGVNVATPAAGVLEPRTVPPVYIFGATWAVLNRTQLIAFAPVAFVLAVRFGIVAPAQSGATVEGFVIDGQEITVTKNEHVAVLPHPSVALKDTAVVPIGKEAPLTGPAVCTIVMEPIPQLVVAVGAVHETVAFGAPDGAVTVISVGQLSWTTEVRQLIWNVAVELEVFSSSNKIK
jgi:hypothetical protein